MELFAQHRTVQYNPLNTPAPRPAPYLRVPDRLLRRFARDPLAVGIYVAVARCALAKRGPAPLSPADLAEWSTGDRTRDSAIMRRITLLLNEGWLTADRGQAIKLRLLPTWGQAATGQLLAWDFQAAHFGKPDSLRIRRVPIELLDTYLGRLDPQPGRTPALITRYFDRPLISLFDLGVYALASLTPQQPTAQLTNVGLFAGDIPQPPRSLAVLLALAEHGVLCQSEETDTSTAPSSQGHQRLQRTRARVHGVHEALNGSPNGSPEPANGSVYGSPNGSPNRSVNAEQTSADFEHPSAAEPPKTVELLQHTWDRNIQVHESPTMHASSIAAGGGMSFPLSQQNTPRLLDPERDTLLQEIGIRNRMVLADVPLALLHAWHQASKHGGLAQRFNDPAAFAYSQLRAGNPPPTARELERWLHSPQHSISDSERHYAPVLTDDDVYQQCVTQAQLLAPIGASSLTVGLIATALRDGQSDAQAVASASAVPMPSSQQSEEVYRALRARAAR